MKLRHTCFSSSLMILPLTKTSSSARAGSRTQTSLPRAAMSHSFADRHTHRSPHSDLLGGEVWVHFSQDLVHRHDALTLASGRCVNETNSRPVRRGLYSPARTGAARRFLAQHNASAKFELASSAGLRPPCRPWPRSGRPRSPSSLSRHRRMVSRSPSASSRRSSPRSQPAIPRTRRMAPRTTPRRMWRRRSPRLLTRSPNSAVPPP